MELYSRVVFKWLSLWRHRFGIRVKLIQFPLTMFQANKRPHSIGRVVVFTPQHYLSAILYSIIYLITSELTPSISLCIILWRIRDSWLNYVQDEYFMCVKCISFQTQNATQLFHIFKSFKYRFCLSVSLTDFFIKLKEIL